MPDRLMANGRTWTKAWCEACHDVREVRVDRMSPDERNPHDALDVICATCHYVIATLHESKPAHGRLSPAQ